MESTPEQAVEGRALVTVLACVLEKLIQANASTGNDHLDDGAVTKFHALRPPGIGIAEYLDRILKYASCSNECFVLGLIYMDRYIQGNEFALTSLNVHRVAITSVMVAAKFFDDQYYNNAYYAKVGGVPCAEMNSLEIAFLFGLDFNLAVTAEEYRNYRMRLAKHAQSSNCGCSSVALYAQPPAFAVEGAGRGGQDRVTSSPGPIPPGYASGWQKPNTNSKNSSNAGDSGVITPPPPHPPQARPQLGGLHQEISGGVGGGGRVPGGGLVQVDPGGGGGGGGGYAQQQTQLHVQQQQAQMRQEQLRQEQLRQQEQMRQQEALRQQQQQDLLRHQEQLRQQQRQQLQQQQQLMAGGGAGGSALGALGTDEGIGYYSDARAPSHHRQASQQQQLQMQQQLHDHQIQQQQQQQGQFFFSQQQQQRGVVGNAGGGSAGGAAGVVMSMMAAATAATVTAAAASGGTTGLSGNGGGSSSRAAGVIVGDGGHMFRVTPSPEHVVVATGMDGYTPLQQQRLLQAPHSAGGPMSSAQAPGGALGPLGGHSRTTSLGGADCAGGGYGILDTNGGGGDMRGLGMGMDDGEGAMAPGYDMGSNINSGFDDGGGGGGGMRAGKQQLQQRVQQRQGQQQLHRQQQVQQQRKHVQQLQQQQQQQHHSQMNRIHSGERAGGYNSNNNNAGGSPTGFGDNGSGGLGPGDVVSTNGMMHGSSSSSNNNNNSVGFSFVTSSNNHTNNIKTMGSTSPGANLSVGGLAGLLDAASGGYSKVDGGGGYRSVGGGGGYSHVDGDEGFSNMDGSGYPDDGGAGVAGGGRGVRRASGGSLLHMMNNGMQQQQHHHQHHHHQRSQSHALPHLHHSHHRALSSGNFSHLSGMSDLCAGLSSAGSAAGAGASERGISGLGLQLSAAAAAGSGNGGGGGGPPGGYLNVNVHTSPMRGFESHGGRGSGQRQLMTDSSGAFESQIAARQHGDLGFESHRANRQHSGEDMFVTMTPPRTPGVEIGGYSGAGPGDGAGGMGGVGGGNASGISGDGYSSLTTAEEMLFTPQGSGSMGSGGGHPFTPQGGSVYVTPRDGPAPRRDLEGVARQMEDGARGVEGGVYAHQCLAQAVSAHPSSREFAREGLDSFGVGIGVEVVERRGGFQGGQAAPPAKGEQGTRGVSGWPLDTARETWSY